MLNEKCSGNSSDSDMLGLKLNSLDNKDVHMTGEIVDTIHYKDGRVEKRVGHNLVVDSFLNLVMCLLKNESGMSGIKYWAVGSGLSTWDDTMPNPSREETTLTSELGRVKIDPSEIVFLDNKYLVSDTPTNIIQITHLFSEADCNGVWREFGIFGGNATEDKDSGVMINKRHHAILTKTSEMTVERVMRFTLTLV